MAIDGVKIIDSDDAYDIYNPPSSPCLRVTLLQTLNTSGKPYHSKIQKTQTFWGLSVLAKIDLNLNSAS